MVVEVARGRVVAEADVDAQVAGGERLAVPRADDLDGLVRQQGQRGDREDLIGVEGPVVGGDAQG